MKSLYDIFSEKIIIYFTVNTSLHFRAQGPYSKSLTHLKNGFDSCVSHQKSVQRNIIGRYLIKTIVKNIKY